MLGSVKVDTFDCAGVSHTYDTPNSGHWRHWHARPTHRRPAQHDRPQRPRPEPSCSAHYDRVEYVAADLATGEGTAAAVDGSEIIIHCAGSNKGDEDKTRHLLEAASKAGCRHLVYISVVGAERIPVVSGVDRAMFGYFASKRASEQVIEASSLPWTTLRATQFHELALLTAQGLAKLPVIPIPAGFRFQPIDSDEVAARLVELALGAPAGQVPDIAGPKTYPMAHLQRSYLHALGMHHVLVPLYVPGKAANAIRHGANLTPDGDLGGRTWEDFLSAHVATAVK